MRSGSRRISTLLVVLGAALAAHPQPVRSALSLPAPVPGFTRAASEALPAVPLRGYGSLAGQYAQFTAPSGGKCSLLVITCPDAARAGITLAKYLSDTACLGGVTPGEITVGAARLPVEQVTGQGALWAARQGAVVAIAATDKPDDLPLFLHALGLDKAPGLDYTGAPVPTYLDKFDKWGWSFWYGMFQAPNDKDADAYDFRQDFDWAQRMGVGLQVQVEANNHDTAEGVVDWAGTDWAVDLARDRGIPTFIQPFAFVGPLWLADRYPYQMMQKMPQFVGNFYTPEGPYGYQDAAHIGWSATEAEDVYLGMMSAVIKRYAAYPNVTGYTEAHGEIQHNTPGIFTEYGPEADKVFRAYLQRRYGTPAAVDQRWYSGRGTIKSWDDIRIPEVASFLGWGPQAVDLQGTWRWAYDHEIPADQLPSWAAPALDVTAWRSLVAPGDDHGMFRPERRTPAVYRRSFDLPAERLAQLQAAGGGKVWLYVWDLEQATSQKITAALNGAVVGEHGIPGWKPDWCAFEVSGALRAGQNLLALRLPWGYISYRVYLSPDAPRCYPDLGPQKDAQWVDFREWVAWTRYDQVRKGMEMIRREDPNRFIKQMAVGAMIGDAKALSEDYGGAFHDTGGMGGNWGDFLPSVSRGAGMPFTAEPGGPAGDLPGLKHMIGCYATEGVNAVDYFIHLGSIMWNPAQKQWFEQNQPLIHLFGKYHSPTAPVAVLHGARAWTLLDYPWDQFNTPLTWGNRHGPLGLEGALPYPRDILVEADFARGNADRYKVILDDNTMIMDEDLIKRIESWVKAGGIFIAVGHSGRHLPEQPDAWPISRLTGYKVIGDDDNRRLTALPGNPVFTDPYWFQTEPGGRPALGGAGLLLQKVAPECTDLLAWENQGGIAAGMRPLGKGWVVTMGTWVAARGWADLLRWAQVPVAIPSAENCRVAQYVSNNGLYDVYVLWGDRVSGPGPTTLTLPGADQPPLLDLLSGQTVTGTPGDSGALGAAVTTYSGLPMDAQDIRPYLAPRHHLTAAPLDWLRLQRSWWKGTKQPAPAPPVKLLTSNALDLSRDWAFAPVPDGADPATLAGPSAKDAPWERRDLGVWDATKYADLKCGIFRKSFTLPAAWIGKGRIYLNFHGSDAASLRPPDKTQLWLDGKLIASPAGSRYACLELELTGQLAAGEHLLALAAQSTTSTGGVEGAMWMEFVPEPALRQDLSGDWGPGLQLPGPVKNLTGAKRTFTPDPRGQGKTVMVYVEAGTMSAVFINGRFLNRWNVPFGSHWRFNLTPYLKWGEENTIELRPHYPEPQTVKSVQIWYYDPRTLQ